MVFREYRFILQRVDCSKIKREETFRVLFTFASSTISESLEQALQRSVDPYSLRYLWSTYKANFAYTTYILRSPSIFCIAKLSNYRDRACTTPIRSSIHALPTAAPLPLIYYKLICCHFETVLHFWEDSSSQLAAFDISEVSALQMAGRIERRRIGEELTTNVFKNFKKKKKSPKSQVRSGQLLSGNL